MVRPAAGFDCHSQHLKSSKDPICSNDAFKAFAGAALGAAKSRGEALNKAIRRYNDALVKWKNTPHHQDRQRVNMRYVKPAFDDLHGTFDSEMRRIADRKRHNSPARRALRNRRRATRYLRHKRNSLHLSLQIVLLVGGIGIGGIGGFLLFIILYFRLTRHYDAMFPEYYRISAAGTSMLGNIHRTGAYAKFISQLRTDQRNHRIHNDKNIGYRTLAILFGTQLGGHIDVDLVLHDDMAIPVADEV